MAATDAHGGKSFTYSIKTTLRNIVPRSLSNTSTGEFYESQVCITNIVGNLQFAIQNGGLQSCLPHQLDLRTGQLWAEGRSTLQLHQQRQPSCADAHLTSSVVLPPDSEIVAPVPIRTPSDVRPGACSLVEPCRALMEDYGVLVGRTILWWMLCRGLPVF